MLATWVFVVCSLITRSAAISAFDFPFATRRSTSSSRAVSNSSPALALGRVDALRELLDQPLGHRRRKESAALRHDANRRHELLFTGVLEQERAGACPKRLEDVLVEVEGRQHEHACPTGTAQIWRVASIPSRFGMRMSMRTTSGLELGRLTDRRVAVVGLADDLDVGLALEDHPEPGADKALVVRQEDADHPGSPNGKARTKGITPLGTAARRAARRRRRPTRSPIPASPWPEPLPPAAPGPSSSTSSSTRRARSERRRRPAPGRRA